MTSVPPREPVVLTGSRAVLSIPTGHDIDRITELCRDAAIAAWTTVPVPYVRADAEGFVFGFVTSGWAHGTGCTWAIRLEPDGPLVGMIGLDGIKDGEAEVGFWLAPDARGRGVMSEAVSLVADYAFAPSGLAVRAASGLGLERLVWHAFTGNAASAAVARRAGFRFEGEHRLGGSQRGRRLDDWQASLLRDDPRTPASGWPEQTFVQREPVEG
ncbi:GNAT family N-acetyltransferase [Leifsonia poae]|uniref:GNAT family N-acetyltransferase n=1 Tax=Leifsonia poae TaxID=110933 RepID=UPI001CBCC855|nr:GNAT family protein [Leifsonia poae]